MSSLKTGLINAVATLISLPAAYLTLSQSALAQSFIVPDDTLGTEPSFVIENYRNLPVEAIIGGVIHDQNLFHSFSEFNISEGRGAYFFSPSADITNIFSRVTGDNPSALLGFLGTFGLSEPDLFLMNPNGFIFGPNALLDVKGSFVVTTANQLQFQDQGFFSATSASPPSILTINPSAFIFDQQVDQPEYSIESEASLSVNEGRSLLLVGGGVMENNTSTSGELIIRAGRLRAPGGYLGVAGLTEPGSILLTYDEDGDPRLVEPQGYSRTSFSMTGEANGFAELDVTSGGGGDIEVYANNINILGGSDICAGIGQASNCGNQATNLGGIGRQAGDIVLDALGTIRLSDAISVVENRVNATGVGDAGDIFINARELIIENEAFISSSSFGLGSAGNVNIDVQDEITNNDGLIEAGIGAFRNTNLNPGDAGDINIFADSLYVVNGGQISALNAGTGNAGNININTDNITVIDGASPDFTSAVSTIVELNGLGNAGDINISTGSFYVLGGGQLASDTRGQGDAGNITINARNEVVFDGFSLIPFIDPFTGELVRLFERPSTALSGTIGAGAGVGGDITINAANRIVLSNMAELSSVGFSGNTGDIFLNARSIELQNGEIQTSVLGPGEGGNISIVGNQILMRQDSDIRSDVPVAGNGGNIYMRANSIIALEDSDILAFASGQGGNITLDTLGFFGENYTAVEVTPELGALDGNAVADVNASGAISGIISVPNVSFLENYLAELPSVLVNPDTLVANSCIVARNDAEGRLSFIGADSFAQQPGNSLQSTYSLGSVQTVADETATATTAIEPEAVYRLADGRLLMSRECGE